MCSRVSSEMRNSSIYFKISNSIHANEHICCRKRNKIRWVCDEGVKRVSQNQLNSNHNVKKFIEWISNIFRRSLFSLKRSMNATHNEIKLSSIDWIQLGLETIMNRDDIPFVMQSISGSTDTLNTLFEINYFAIHRQNSDENVPTTTHMYACDIRGWWKEFLFEFDDDKQQ